MKKTLLLLALMSLTKIIAQDVPVIQLNDSTQLKLSILKVDVKVIGNFATTTYDMKFFNGTDRTLEGELQFPLGEGQAVSGFEMEVNGEMREAVIVEKELARVAYESTIRQNIDPGLLEKVQGNNYKARIYPILPNGYKQIRITYEQELFALDDHYVYELPMGFKDKLEKFSIQFDVYGNTAPQEDTGKLVFKQQDNKYSATFDKENYIPKKSIVIKIPNLKDEQKVITYNDFFYVNRRLAPNTRIKKKPKKITLLWDSSFSRLYKKTKKEMEVLDLYFQYLQNVTVMLVSFNNDISTEKSFAISSGNWDELKEEITKIQYDGGTSFQCLSSVEFKSDEILLFTDGLSNLGSYSSSLKTPIYVLNTSVSADHEVMNLLATSSGGSYINLGRYSGTAALKILKHETFQFLGVEKNSNVFEVYPNSNTNVTSDFSIAGRFSENTTIKLLFGYQNKVSEEIEVQINTTSNEKIVKKIWAKKKLKALLVNKKENKSAIVSLAKQHRLITEYTSMLILDRIEDYVRYRIEPPKELKALYEERIANLEEEELEKQEDLADRREDLFEDYEDLMEWYTTKFPKRTSKPIKQPDVGSTAPAPRQVAEQNPNPVPTVAGQTGTTPTATNGIEINQVYLDTTKRSVSGVVTDDGGLPLPGVNIRVDGTEIVAQTDFDGNFIINAEVEQELVFSYLGFAVTRVSANTSGLNVKMPEDAAMLEEVVVTAQGISVQKRTLSAYVTTIQKEEISESLQGAVSGVNITAQNGSVGSSTSVTIRGVTSLSNSAQPLYVVDGVVVEGNPTEDLSPDKIESMQVLNETNGTAIYGARGVDGVILITTKAGKEANGESIATFNKEISDKIALKPWQPNEAYIAVLEKEKTTVAAYNKYIEIRDDYANIPFFYIEVADFFEKRKSPERAIQILSNLIEVELDNYELMKALAYKLEYFGKYELAVVVYQKVLELRPEEPQSYRDLALAYEYIGEFQKSFDLLYQIYNGELLEKDLEERFYGIEHLAFIELNRLVFKYGKQLKLSKKKRALFSETPVDIRIVVDWNHNDTDLDLWVIDPNEEKGYYKNSETDLGGRLSEDMVDGYGPEEFMLKKAIKGDYKVMIDYFADAVQKISGPTILKVTLFTNYGRKNESKKISIVRLDKEEDELEVGRLRF